MGSKCCRGVKVAVEKTYKALKPNPVDPNKLNHIFGKAQHNLDDLLNNAFGGNQEKAFRAMEAAVKAKKPCPGQTFQVQVTIRSRTVTVRGAVDQAGNVTIGTAFSP